MVDENLKRSVIQDVTLLKLVGFKPIIMPPPVAAARRSAAGWARSAWSPNSSTACGLRIKETMEIAEMVLGKVGKKAWYSWWRELGVKAVSISGKDGGLLKVEKKYSKGEDIGFVGEVTDGSPDSLRPAGEGFPAYRMPGGNGQGLQHL